MTVTAAREAIRDASQLVIGRSYVVVTGEPQGEFRVGAFKGWTFYNGETHEAGPLVTKLPEDWKDKYPYCVFERAVVGDHYMLEAIEETPLTT